MDAEQLREKFESLMEKMPWGEVQQVYQDAGWRWSIYGGIGCEPYIPTVEHLKGAARQLFNDFMKMGPPEVHSAMSGGGLKVEITAAECEGDMLELSFEGIRRYGVAEYLPPTANEEECRDNYQAFLRELPQLLKTDEGKFALMRRQKIMLLLDTFRDALKVGRHIYGYDGVFSIQEITDKPVYCYSVVEGSKDLTCQVRGWLSRET